VKQPIVAAIDSTGFGARIPVSEVKAMREYESVKLHALYDASSS